MKDLKTPIIIFLTFLAIVTIVQVITVKRQSAIRDSVSADPNQPKPGGYVVLIKELEVKQLSVNNRLSRDLNKTLDHFDTVIGLMNKVLDKQEAHMNDPNAHEQQRIE